MLSAAVLRLASCVHPLQMFQKARIRSRCRCRRTMDPNCDSRGLRVQVSHQVVPLRRKHCNEAVGLMPTCDLWHLSDVTFAPERDIGRMATIVMQFLHGHLKLLRRPVQRPQRIRNQPAVGQLSLSSSAALAQPSLFSRSHSFSREIMQRPSSKHFTSGQELALSHTSDFHQVDNSSLVGRKLVNSVRKSCVALFRNRGLCHSFSVFRLRSIALLFSAAKPLHASAPFVPSIGCASFCAVNSQLSKLLLPRPSMSFRLRPTTHSRSRRSPFVVSLGRISDSQSSTSPCVGSIFRPRSCLRSPSWTSSS